MKEHVIEGIEEFSIEQIADSGQAFRWNKDKEGFIGVVGDKVINVKQCGDKIFIKILNYENGDDYDKALKYFDLSRNYKNIIEEIKDKDGYIKSAVECGKGIRILKQDLWEVIISFIISANNNILRIKKSIELICENYGNLIMNTNGREYYSFPTVDQLSSASIDDLRQCGVGFRAAYIFKTTKLIQDNCVCLDEVRKMDTDSAREYLKKLPGVGDKIADCILLFACHKFDVFPVDTWMKKVMCEFYNLNSRKNCEIYQFARNHFGEHCGIAQQYLFYYARGNKHLFR